jgi:acyl transferase domain-containing protein
MSESGPETFANGVGDTSPFESEIAIVGMAGRFPGSPSVDDLWLRVRDGDDCLTDLTADDLRASGVDDTVLSSPEYVRRSGVLDGVDCFDAGFFGIGARDAAIMDPQHRLFLECTWEALESAGYVPEKFGGSIGVFAGCGANTYMFNNLLSDTKLLDQVGWFLLRHTGNDKDFLTTGVSYRLDLRGPSINVQTACSTSLVAVHLAVQSLLLLECDMAIAGGVTIEVPHGVGYRYHEGEILAPDGRCRAFDAASGGTVLTSGVGAVVLRRAADAVRDGDPILALIKGSAVNNDGSRKVSYLAPSIDGHADVVREALAVSGVDARSIGLIEAHGTGTALGDPIEFNALTQAFRSQTDDTGFCRITSTKPNIGHLDTAAGVASLIKVVQSLQNRWLPPLANYTAPSPLLELAGSPFELSGEGRPWHSAGPRRAGVSSLGVGGTNAHVVVEEAPVRQPSPAALPEQVLMLSARSDEGLDRLSDRLAEFLTARPDTPLADVAHTLKVGRRELTHRRVVVATDTSDAIKLLQHPDPRRSHRAVATDPAPEVGFLFPGGGSQHPGMGAGLDERFIEFHRVRDEGIMLVERHSGLDLTPLLAADADAEALRHPTASLPAILITEIALARQWMAWGVQPAALVGHSLGEYAAAHLAGVLSFEDAVRLVVARATLMERVGGEGAAMMAVPLSESELVTLLPATLSLAAVNTRDECVVSGPAEAIDLLAATLADQDVTGIRIPLAAAAHSSLLDPVLAEFLDVVRTVSLLPPKIRYVSNLTGTWITAAQATDPQYWVDHLRGTVRFADGLTAALTDNPLVLVELGPGQALSSYARRSAIKPVAIIAGLRHPADTLDDTAHVLAAFGRVWAHGYPMDVARTIGSGSGRLRLSLPTYPFERTRYWIEATGGRRGISDTAPAGPAGAHAASDGPPPLRRIDRLEDWAWEQVWEERSRAVPSTDTIGPWLVVADADDRDAAAVATRLQARGEQVDLVSAFDAEAPAAKAARAVLIAATRLIDDNVVDQFTRAQERLVGDATQAARTLAAGNGAARLAILTRGSLSALDSATRPINAMALGVTLVAPREYNELQTALVDVATDEEFDAAAVTDELVGSTASVVAFRGARLLAPAMQRHALPVGAPDATHFRDGGTYLVTGGLSGIGHAIALDLASTHHINLVVTSTECLPAPADRAAFLATHSPNHPTCRRLRALAALDAVAAQVAVLVADTADPASLRRALDEAEDQFGRIDGAVHAAGRLVDRLLETVTPADLDAVIGAKARGAVVLADELERRGADLLVLVSSTSTLLAPAGQSGYVAANATLDALAGAHGGLQVVTINYGVWAGTGMAADAARRANLGLHEGHPIDHPVLAECAPGRNGATEFVARLDTRQDWIVDEHRVGATEESSGTGVLPGTGHLELMLAALRQLELPLVLGAVSLHEPLVVHDGADVTVRITVSAPDDTSSRTVQIESDGGSARDWILHSEAVVPSSKPGTVAVPERVDLDAHDLDAHVDGDSVDVLAQPRQHVRFGPRWNCVVTATGTEDTIFARLRLPDAFAAESSAWMAHPALVDVATACGVTLAAQGDDVLFVPSHYDRVTSHAPLTSEVIVVTRRQHNPPADVFIVDLTVADAHGTVLCEIDGLTLRPVADLGRFTTTPTAPTPAARGRGTNLLDLVADHGIRAPEGVELLKRVVASGAPRLLLSSIELDDLYALGASDDASGGSGDGAATTGGTSGSLVDLLAEIWTDLLGVSPIGLDDDFFELGGHSLIAIRLMSRIHKQFGVRLQLATLFEAPTIAKLVNVLFDADPELAQLGPPTTDAEPVSGAEPATTPDRSGTAKRTLPQSLVLMRDGSSDETPLFLVHGAGGNVLNLWGLARALPAGRQIYGLQAHGIDGSVAPDNSIEEMAQRYVGAIRAIRPTGPYLLGGYSGGGVVALEMSRIFVESGDRVPRVVLLDTVPSLAEVPSLGRALLYAVENAVRSGPASLVPWLRFNWECRVLRRGRPTLDDLDALDGELGGVEQFGFVNLWTHFTEVAQRYEFTRYDVDVIVAKAQEVFPGWPWHYKWRGKVSGAIDTVIVPGDHHKMFTEDNAPVLARGIAPYLVDSKQ